jgi:predicted nucleic acid-binding protein
MELLGFKNHSEKSFKRSKIFLENADIIGLDDNIVEAVITLRRSKSIKLPDAIILATAKNNNLIIVTRNDKDFKGDQRQLFL